MALILTLGGCNAIGGAFSSVRGAVFPRGDEANSSQASGARPVASSNAVSAGGGSNEARIAALEEEVAALRQELAALKPSIERLVGIEGDIRILLTQLSRLSDAETGPTPGVAPAQPEQAAQPAPAAPAQPPALRPVQPGAPSGQPQSLRAIQPPAAQPAQPAPAPTQLTQGAPGVAPAEQVSVHLASFRELGLARTGWRELQAAHSDLLGGLDYRISAVELSGGRGTFYRVKAGPFTDTASAEEVCRLLKARNAYCVLSDFTGDR